MGRESSIKKGLEFHATTLIRENLLKIENYTPYCGDGNCLFSMPRTAWDGEQFKCRCGWRSSFPKDFIDFYKKIWGK